jgi:hypothetical protein
MPYPEELLHVQSRAIERQGWNLGSPAARPSSDTAQTLRADVTWAPDTTGLQLVVAYERPADRRISALLIAGRDEGSDVLRLVRLDSAEALPSRTALESRWSRFPSFGALSDSIRDDSGRLERGPVRFDLTPTGVAAYQAYFARRSDGATTLAWVSVATDARLGAGRTFEQAWSNLLGSSAPTVAGVVQASRLEEARRLMIRADSALKTGDWVTFGKVWDSLRKSFGIGPDSEAR